MLEEGDVDAAGRLVVQKMHEGNLSAARLIIDHVDPKPRGRPIALDVAPDASLVERYAALTRAMLAGDVSPQEATAMARLLEREAALRAPAALAPLAQQSKTEPATVEKRDAAPVAAPAPDLHSACMSGARVARGAMRRQAPMASSRRPAPASDLHLQARHSRTGPAASAHHAAM